MVWVRILGALGLALATGGAQASSFVVLGASTSTPSVVRPEPVKVAEGAKAGLSTPSIVALGEPVPDVTYEKVAAIPGQSEPRHDFMQSPMIIRGGIVGGAFATPGPRTPAATTAAAAPGAGTRSDKRITATDSDPATPQPTPIPEIDQAR